MPSASTSHPLPRSLWPSSARCTEQRQVRLGPCPPEPSEGRVAGSPKKGAGQGRAGPQPHRSTTTQRPPAGGLGLLEEVSQHQG